jgi:hypothetical protein
MWQREEVQEVLWGGNGVALRLSQLVKIIGFAHGDAN